MVSLQFDGKLLRKDVLLKASGLAEHSNVTLPPAENYLFKSENFLALAILTKYYRESIDLVYIDPPFNTMQDFYISEGRANSVSSAKSRQAYSDKMPLGQFLAFLRERLIVIY